MLQHDKTWSWFLEPDGDDISIKSNYSLPALWLAKLGCNKKYLWIQSEYECYLKESISCYTRNQAFYINHPLITKWRNLDWSPSIPGT